MKKSTVYIGLGVLVLVGVFYWNMYRNGSFNEVVIEEKDSVTHKIYGTWVEGTLKNPEDEERLMNVQKEMIEGLGVKEVAVFYEINPRKENQEHFKALIGTESSDVLKQKNFSLYVITLEKVLSGRQQCTPGFQKIHGELLDFSGTKENIQLRQDSIFESYQETEVYVEMKFIEQ